MDNPHNLVEHIPNPGVPEHDDTGRLWAVLVGAFLIGAVLTVIFFSALVMPNVRQNLPEPGAAEQAAPSEIEAEYAVLQALVPGEIERYNETGDMELEFVSDRMAIVYLLVDDGSCGLFILHLLEDGQYSGGLISGPLPCSEFDGF